MASACIASVFQTVKTVEAKEICIDVFVALVAGVSCMIILYGIVVWRFRRKIVVGIRNHLKVHAPNDHTLII